MDGHVDDRIALYALGGLEADEQAEVERHLAICPRCRALADEAIATASQLAYVAEPVTPNPDTKQQLMAQIRTEESRPIPSRSASARSRVGIPRFQMPQIGDRLRRWAPAIAFAALALALLGLNLNLQARLADALRENASLSAELDGRNRQLAALQAATIRVHDPSGSTVSVVVQGLFPLSPDKAYQLWLIPNDGKPVSAGVFEPGPDGRIARDVTASLPLSNLKAIGISREPVAGSPQPTDVIVIQPVQPSS